MERINNILKDNKFGISIVLQICNYYHIEDENILDTSFKKNNNEYLIHYKLTDGREYKIRLEIGENVKILVELLDKGYIDTFKLYPRGFILKKNRIYENKDNNIKVIESHQKYYSNDYKPDSKIFTYNTYFYKFINDNLDSNIIISIPNIDEFDNNLFIEYLLNSINIYDIDDLYKTIKFKINIDTSYINIKNLKSFKKEKIIVSKGFLEEYRKVKNNTVYEYKRGDKDLRIIKYEYEDIYSEDMKKIFKLVRS